MKLLLFAGLILILLFWMTPAESSKILIFIPISSKSHKAPLEILGNELAKRGHEITIVSCFKPSKSVPRVKTVFLNDVNQLTNVMSTFASNFTSPSFSSLMSFVDIFEQLCREMFNDSNMKDFLKNPGQFDVIMSPTAMLECYLGLTKKLNAPLVLFSTSVMFPHTAWNMNLPSPASYIPILTMSATQDMSFSERLKNVFLTGFLLVFFQLYLPWKMDKVAMEYVPDIISSVDAVRNASLLLVNSHFSLEDPRPSLPNVIEVGGLNCRPAEKLPQEFDKFIEGSKDDGFIVFSLGSVLQSQYMPPNLLNTFKSVFAQLKQRVIWKFEKQLDDLSANVMISSWIPQQDLVGHPKCKLVITHGGILSLQEAAYHGVPSLGIPMGADRDQNYFRAVQKGFALTVDHLTVTPQILLQQINKLLTDPKYKQKATEISVFMKDRPQTALDTAVYWMEYIIRHKGASQLKTKAENLNFFQYFLLDVFAVLFGGFLFVVVLLVFLVKGVIKLFERRSSKEKTN